MLSVKIVRIMLLVSLLSLGVWLVARPAQIQPETVERQETIRQAYSLTGVQPDGSGGPDQFVDVIRHEPVSPVVVNLLNLPVDPDLGNSQFDRW